MRCHVEGVRQPTRRDAKFCDWSSGKIDRATAALRSRKHASHVLYIDKECSRSTHAHIGVHACVAVVGEAQGKDMKAHPFQMPRNPEPSERSTLAGVRLEPPGGCSSSG